MNPFVKIKLALALAAGLAAVHAPAQTSLNLGRLPLWFEANRGQADATSPFIAHGQDSEFLISASGAQFVLRKASGKTAAARMQIVGANPGAQVSGDSPLVGQVNYLVGNQPAHWQSGVTTFAKVRVENIYAGINVVYYGNGRQLEYDFDLAPGTNPQTIALRFDGAEKISVNSQGELVVSLNGGEVIQHQPVVYQEVGGTRHEISGGYKLLDAHTATFALGSYDHSRALVIDPILSYSTFFGGNNTDIAHAIAVDTTGCIYIAGETLSTSFTNLATGTFKSYQTNFQGGTVTGDAFVAKLKSDGSTLVYFTYLGGSADDAAYGLAVDNAGNAYITGATESTDFPTNRPLPGFGQIAGKEQSQGFYLPDAFVAELNTNGSALVFSTYLGGNAQDIGKAIALDTAGNAYVAGYTSSTNFPFTVGALQTNLLCTNTLFINANAFVTEISNTVAGPSLAYSTFLGGTNYDQANSIFVDASGFIYVAGFTASTNFPTFHALPQFQHLNGAITNTSADDAFVCKFNPNFAGRVYSTFLGGTNSDAATGIAADGGGNAYVVGWTVSTNFPGAQTNDLNGVRFVKNYLTNNVGLFSAVTTNTFLTEISADGSTILHTAVFGGIRMDVGNGVGLDAAGNIFVAGSTLSTNFPVTTNNLIGSLRATNSGNLYGNNAASDAFVIAFKADWSALLYSTYLGGNASDSGNAIAVNSAGNVYVTGRTFSTNYPSFNAFQPALNTTLHNNTSDAFLTIILPAAPAPLLTATASGTNILVSWPPVGEEVPAFFGLETTTNLLATNAWILATNTPVFTNNGVFTYHFDPTNRAQFFRLYKY